VGIIYTHRPCFFVIVPQEVKIEHVPQFQNRNLENNPVKRQNKSILQNRIIGKNMNTLKIGALIGATLCITAGAASAQDAGDTSASLGLTTFGPSYESAYQIDQNWRVRGVVMGGITYSGEEEDNGNTFEVDANLGAFAAIADYYPTDYGWRVSGGLLINFTGFDSTSTASASNGFEIDGTEYNSGSVTLDGNFKNKISPVITTGYDYRFGGNWLLSGEVGAIYTGGVDVVATGSTTVLQNAIDASTDYKKAREDASDLTFYPYVSFSVGYTF
jgi:hypothetical protein